MEDDAAIRAVARDAQRVAVLGVKTEAQAGQPAFYVAAALAADGVEIVPVPVYYPEVTQILGRPVVRRVVDAPGPLEAPLPPMPPYAVTFSVALIAARTLEAAELHGARAPALPMERCVWECVVALTA